MQTEMPPDIKTGKSATMGLLLALSALILAQPVAAADWGYDDMGDSSAEAASAPAPRVNGDRGGNGVGKNRSRAAAKSSTPRASAPGVRPRATRGAAAGSGTTADETSLSPQGQGQDQDQNRDQNKDQNRAPLQPAKPAPPPAPTAAELSARNKVVDLKSWMEIYALAASSARDDDRGQILNLKILSEETRKKLEQFTFEKIEQNVPEYLGIGPIWIPLSKKISEDLDYKESYRLLFRALLRHAVDRLEPTAVQAELIHELLGPTRIAEIGPPVLTEEAIDAYNDMTCFLYSKRHPEHTLEGDDNRRMFAEVIRGKYNDAPNMEAKRAMCKFDLTWAAFRCRYLDASPADKDKLLISMEDKSGGRSQTTPGKASATGAAKKQSVLALTSPKLIKLFGMGPWAESAKTTPVAVKMNQMSLPTK